MSQPRPGSPGTRPRCPRHPPTLPGTGTPPRAGGRDADRLPLVLGPSGGSKSGKPDAATAVALCSATSVTLPPPDPAAFEARDPGQRSRPPPLTSAPGEVG